MPGPKGMFEVRISGYVRSSLYLAGASCRKTVVESMAEMGIGEYTLGNVSSNAFGEGERDYQATAIVMFPSAMSLTSLRKVADKKALHDISATLSEARDAQTVLV